MKTKAILIISAILGSISSGYAAPFPHHSGSIEWLNATRASLPLGQIFQFAGIPAPTGFTNVIPTAPVCLGVNTLCAGSEVIYVSAQSGNDSNAGTITAPLQHKATACADVGGGAGRDGKPDQILLKGGDTFPTSDQCTFNDVNLDGAGPCTNVGGNCSGPIVFGAYNLSGGWPINQTNNSGQCFAPNFGTGTGTANYLVIQYWDCIAIDRDPNLSTYTYAGATGSADAIELSNMTTSWILVENTKIEFYADAINLQGASHTSPQGTIILRRNIVNHTYCAAPQTSACDSSGFFEAFDTGPQADSNYFFVTGWDDLLTKPQSVAVSGNTLTWPSSGTGYGFTGLPFGNGALLFFQSTCGSAVAGTAYTVANVSGNSFNVQLSGSTVSLSGCTSPTTMMWEDPELTIFNHHFYYQTASAAQILTNNVTLWGNDLKNSTGGTVTGNFASNNTLGIVSGATSGSEPPLPTPTITTLNATGNVIQHILAFFPGTGGKFTYPGDGCAPAACTAYGLNNASGSGVQIEHNILSQLGTGGSGGLAVTLSLGGGTDVTGVDVINNIIYGAQTTPINLNGNSGNTTSPQYCSDPNENNNSGTCPGVEPFSSPTNDLFSYILTLPGAPGSCTGTGPANTCMAFYMNSVTGQNPGSWNAALAAPAIISYIKTGFGNPF